MSTSFAAARSSVVCLARRSSGLTVLLAVALLSSSALASKAPTASPAGDEHYVLHHRADVVVDLKQHALDVTDELHVHDRLLNADGPSRLHLLLHASATPTADGATLKKVSTRPDPGFQRLVQRSVPFQVWEVTLAKGKAHTTLRYRVQLPSTPDSPHHVDSNDVFVGPEALWLPTLDEALVSGELTIRGLPDGWQVLSEGASTTSDAATTSRAFASGAPTPGLHVLAGRWHSTSRKVGATDVQVWLLQRDAALAEDVLLQTQAALRTYEGLLGAYPHAQFTVVESRWQVGVAMPGWTLFGSHLLRRPEVRRTSLPHELLHTFFGAGVYVDGGNWAEGLTSYLADHHRAERMHDDVAHRRRALQKFMTQVTPQTDLPIEQFSSRTTPAAEAVGYGKWMMVLHNFRRQIGDNAFRQVVRSFFGRHVFSRARFADFVQVASAVTQRDWAPYFKAWTTTKGLPQMRWEDVRVQGRRNGPYAVSVELRQTQPGRFMPMAVPVHVTLDDGSVVERMVMFTSQKTARGAFATDRKPVHVAIDPLLDTPRHLHLDERPATIADVRHASSTLFVLPSVVGDQMKAAFKSFADAWCTPRHGPAKDCKVVRDDDEFDLGAADAVVVMGYGNRMRGVFAQLPVPHRLDDENFHTADGRRLPHAKHALAVVKRHPVALRRDRGGAVLFVASAFPQAIHRLARVLPHYGKYSGLSFAGEAARNVYKVTWPTEPASMQVDLSSSGAAPRPLTQLPLVADQGPYVVDDVLLLAAAVHDILQAPAPGGGPLLALTGVEEHLRQTGWKVGRRACRHDAKLTCVEAEPATASTEQATLRTSIGLHGGQAAAVVVAAGQRFMQLQAKRGVRLVVSSNVQPPADAQLGEVVLQQLPGELSAWQGSGILRSSHVVDDVVAAAVVPMRRAPGGVGFTWTADPLTSPRDAMSLEHAQHLLVVSAVHVPLVDENSRLPARVDLGIVTDFKYEGPGIRVHGVASTSAAATAGVQAGDVLVSVDGRKLRSKKQYSFMLYRLKAGQVLQVRVLRDGKEQDVTLKVP